MSATGGWPCVRAVDLRALRKDHSTERQLDLVKNWFDIHGTRTVGVVVVVAVVVPSRH